MNILQRRFVLSFVGTIRMPVAGRGGERGEGRVFAAAVFAGVAGLLGAFVEGMLALVRP